MPPIQLQRRPAAALLTTPERSPMDIQRGRGCRITDVDGHEHIDLLMAFGAFLLGDAAPEVDADTALLVLIQSKVG